MNKRILAKIKPAKAPVQMTLADHGAKYVVNAEYLEDLLCVTFFEVREQQDTCAGPKLRTFFDFSNDDYITQDMSSSKTKWLTGKIDAVTSTDYWRMDRRFVIDEESKKIIEDAFPADDPSTHWIVRIYKWQNGILKKRREERYKAELAPTDEVMKLVPELPAGFEHWAEYEGMRRFNVIPYTYTDRKIVPAYCPVCDTELNFDKRKMTIRRGERASCPSCGTEGKLLPLSADFNPERWKMHWVAIIQRINGSNNGFVIRYFYTQLFHAVKAGCWPKRVFSMRETIRTFYTEYITGQWNETVYEYAKYKNSDLVSWCPYSNKNDTGGAVLYTDNLPDELAGTPWQYCSVDRLQALMGAEEIHLPLFMRYFRNQRFLEYLIKAGMPKLVQDLTTHWRRTDAVNVDGTTITEIFGLTKPYMKILREMNGGTDVLTILQQMQADNVIPKSEELTRFVEVFGADRQLVRIIDRYADQMSITRFISYIIRQTDYENVKRRQVDAYGYFGHGRFESVSAAKERATKDTMNDWMDYIANSLSLGTDLTDLYYLLPKNLKEAHDKSVLEVEAENRRKAEEERKRLNAAIKKIVKEMTGISALKMKTDKYVIVVPRNTEELKREGTALHHCVGTYAERVAKGETCILFVRKSDKPDEPYFTMEWRDNEIKQIRGRHNCDPPKDVLAFAKAFARKMRKEAEDACTKNAIVSTTSRAS